MSRKLSYKQRLKWLAAGSLVVIICCYTLAISKTVDEYRQYGSLLSETDHAEQVNASFASLNAREELLNMLFSKFQLDTLRQEKNLLSVTSMYCKENNLQLKEYRPFSLSKKDSIRMLTRIVTVEGPFVSCLKLLYALESEGKVGRISSAEFKSFTDPQDKKTKLNCTIFIQNLIASKNENNQ